MSIFFDEDIDADGVSRRKQKAVDESRSARAKRIYSTDSSQRKEEDTSHWSELRKRVASYTCWSSRFEVLLLLVVLFNVIVMVLETDVDLQCPSCDTTHFIIINNVLLLVYTLEVLLSMFVQREDFCSLWNILDLIIVLQGFSELILILAVGGGGPDLIKMLKLARVLRVVKLVRPFPELYKLITGFLSTLKTMVWSVVLIFMLMGMFALITLQIASAVGIGDTFDDAWCNDAFTSFNWMFVMLFQITIAGDSWGNCVIPASRSQPAMFFLFVIEFGILQVGFMNLILAVIVDGSADARADQGAEKVAKMRKERKDAIEGIYALLRELDTDQSGTVDEEEIRRGLREDEKLAARFEMLGIFEDDLCELLQLMDTDSSGDVGYKEFCSTLWRVEQDDSRMQALYSQFHIQSLHHMMEERFTALETMLGSLTGTPRPEDLAQLHTKARSYRENMSKSRKLMGAQRAAKTVLHTESPSNGRRSIRLPLEASVEKLDDLALQAAQEAIRLAMQNSGDSIPAADKAPGSGPQISAAISHWLESTAYDAVNERMVETSDDGRMGLEFQQALNAVQAELEHEPRRPSDEPEASAPLPGTPRATVPADLPTSGLSQPEAEEPVPRDCRSPFRI